MDSMSGIFGTITFATFSEKHYAIMHQWLQNEHVRLFWDDGDRTLEQVITHYQPQAGVLRYVIYVENNPIGYIQSYKIEKGHAYENSMLEDRENGGMDFFIGDTAYINKKLAYPILCQFIAEHCHHIDRLIVDPHRDNHKARHIYQKYGFIEIGEVLAIHIRRSVRAIIFNPKNEILLMQIQGGPTQNKDTTFWCMLGGKIEKEESIESALVRELKEEAGIIHPVKLYPLAFGEIVLHWNDFPTRVIEKFYVVNIAFVNLHQNALTEEETLIIQGFHWWTIEDLRITNDIIFPQCLAQLATEYLESHHWEVKEIDLN